MVQAILFDADGVLVDPGEMHYQAFNRALATHGWCLTRAEHRTTYNGLPTRAKLDKLTQEKGLPLDLHRAILLDKEKFTRQTILEYLAPDPVKIELLRALKTDGFALAACSNMIQGALMLMLEQVKLASYLDVVIGNDLQRPAKPQPHLYRAAAALSGHELSTCAIVVDGPISLQAARAAKPADVVEVDGPRAVDVSLVPRLTRFWQAA
ncbi:HAD family hydrolase [bacterium]|nr:MAG: HAD family hydrolase [bacterium]